MDAVTLWKKYNVKLNERLRNDLTYEDGIKGRPTRLPLLFKTEMLIKDYLSFKIKNYNDLNKIQYGGVLSPEKLLEKYNVALLSKLTRDHTFREEVQQITTLPDAFLFPKHGKNKYAEWLVNSYLANGIKNYDEIHNLYTALDDYETLFNMKVLNSDKFNNEYDITIFCGLNGCTKNGKKLPGLQSLLDRHVENLKKAQQKAEATKKSIPIYDGKDITIYNIESKAEACKYGKNTKWCTASKDDEKNRYETYKKKGNIYTIIPKRPRYTGEKYQFQTETYSYMNEVDNYANLFDLVRIYPELVDFMYTLKDVCFFTLAYLVGKHLDLVQVIYEDKSITLYKSRSDPYMQALIPKKPKYTGEAYCMLLKYGIALTDKRRKLALELLYKRYPSCMRVIPSSEYPKQLFDKISALTWCKFVEPHSNPGSLRMVHILSPQERVEILVYGDKILFYLEAMILVFQWTAIGIFNISKLPPKHHGLEGQPQFVIDQYYQNMSKSIEKFESDKNLYKYNVMEYKNKRMLFGAYVPPQQSN